jgi:hypothetical protein
VDGDPGWYMAWSDGLTDVEAMNRAYQHMGPLTTDVSRWFV